MTPQEKLVYGSYEVLKNDDGSLFVLGEGSFGLTYKARHVFLGRVSALKVIREELLNQGSKTDHEESNRFLSEARAVGRLNHPGIATIHDCAIDQGVFYYAMEFCDGGTLQDWCDKNGPMPWPEVRQIALQIAAALDYAHSIGFLHRDLKPANIMLNGEGAARQIKLIDFGLAIKLNNAIESSSATVRVDQQVFRGNFATASPEQILEQPLDQRSDLFSLGVTLWWLLIGKNPFGDMKRGPLIADRVGPSSYASTLPLDLDPEARLLLEGLLEKDAGNRTASARVVVDLLSGSIHSAAASTPLAPLMSEEAPHVLEPLPAPPDLEEGYSMGGILSAGSQIKLYAARTLDTDEAVVAMVPGSSLDADALGGMRFAASCQLDFGAYAMLDWRDSGGSDVFILTKPQGCSLLLVLRKFGPAKFGDALPFLSHLARCCDSSIDWTSFGIQMDPGEILVRARDGSTDIERFSSWSDLDPQATRCLPLFASDTENAAATEATLSSSSAREFPPIAQFAALIYRILAGTAVRYAAFFTSNGYVMASGLSEDGNVLLADTICAPSTQPSACRFLQLLASLESLPMSELSPITQAPSAEEIEIGKMTPTSSPGSIDEILTRGPLLQAAAVVPAKFDSSVSVHDKVAELERELALARQAAEAETLRLEEARREQEREAQRLIEEAKRQAEEKAREEAEARQRAEENRLAAEARRIQDEKRRVAEEAAARQAEMAAEARRAAQAAAQAAAEASRLEAEAKRKAAEAEEARKKAEAEAAEKAAAEEARRKEEEAKRAAAEEAKKIAEEEARKKEEEAKKAAAEEARLREEELKKAAEESRLKAEEAQRAAQEEARRAIEEARQAAEERKRLDAERKAAESAAVARRKEEEAKRKAEEQEAKRQAEQKKREEEAARKAAEADAKRKAAEADKRRLEEEKLAAKAKAAAEKEEAIRQQKEAEQKRAQVEPRLSAAVLRRKEEEERRKSEERDLAASTLAPAPVPAVPPKVESSPVPPEPLAPLSSSYRADKPPQGSAKKNVAIAACLLLLLGGGFAAFKRSAGKDGSTPQAPPAPETATNKPAVPDPAPSPAAPAESPKPKPAPIPAKATHFNVSVTKEADDKAGGYSYSDLTIEEVGKPSNKKKPEELIEAAPGSRWKITFVGDLDDKKDALLASVVLALPSTLTQSEPPELKVTVPSSLPVARFENTSPQRDYTGIQFKGPDAGSIDEAEIGLSDNSSTRNIKSNELAPSSELIKARTRPFPTPDNPALFPLVGSGGWSAIYTGSLLGNSETLELHASNTTGLVGAVKVPRPFSGRYSLFAPMLKFVGSELSDDTPVKIAGNRLAEADYFNSVIYPQDLGEGFRAHIAAKFSDSGQPDRIALVMEIDASEEGAEGKPAAILSFLSHGVFLYQTGKAAVLSKTAEGIKLQFTPSAVRLLDHTEATLGPFFESYRAAIDRRQVDVDNLLSSTFTDWIAFRQSGKVADGSKIDFSKWDSIAANSPLNPYYVDVVPSGARLRVTRIAERIPKNQLHPKYQSSPDAAEELEAVYLRRREDATTLLQSSP
ncbi:protein kinase [Luteolibacter sp. GHJ8]|uniref:Protein kinase n=1 Tax=Luteolibacter rhizosphaerae TaxID=2989719 RepID=A0ABT3G4N1_9BACT|nr:serine/threonine protein kinase [Luteolibacter rhizosphaerae]MCW1914783.1 protein kinase [Luteolibacter rhizosphaerae]